MKRVRFVKDDGLAAGQEAFLPDRVARSLIDKGSAVEITEEPAVEVPQDGDQPQTLAIELAEGPPAANSSAEPNDDQGQEKPTNDSDRPDNTGSEEDGNEDTEVLDPEDDDEAPGLPGSGDETRAE